MTRLILDPEPRLQAANVTIHHLQLRDLIQPVGKGKVLFVNKFRIEQADFSSPTPKPNTTFCTLDFSPNCISVGCGLLAAGGQQSELAIRPLHSPSSTSSSRDRDRDRPAPWLLKTPTGGSINNAISIEYDTDHKPQASTSQLPSGTSETRNTNWNALYWTRDEPGGRLRNESHNPDHQMQLDQDQRSLQEEDYLYLDEVGEGVEAGVDENMDLESDALAAAYGFSRTPTLAPSRGSRTSTSRDPQRSSKANSASNPTLNNLSAQQHPQLPIRLMISNNDQSIKIYRLRQPTSTPGQDGRLESGLPGLTRVNTIEFPTCVNHSSISPSNRNLIAVGDTPDVFLYSFDKEGKFEKIATYLASSDASFSTAWHPDGHQMAVASQDGIISVWDVRSSKKIASLSTSQSGSSNGAARCLKYSPNGDYLAFTEHRNYFHIVDTLSYTDHQKIMVKPASALGDSLSERASSTHGEGSSSTTRGVPGLMRTRPMQDFRQRFQEHQWQSSSSRRNGNGDGNSSGRAVTLEDLLARNEILSRIRPSNRASNSPDSRTLHQDEVDEVLATTSSLTNSSDEPSWEDSLPIFGRVIEPGWELPRIRNFNSGWNLVPPSSSRSREPSINIAGLCFCPSGEAVYCATENLIARYSFVDTRRSSQNCGLR